MTRRKVPFIINFLSFIIIVAVVILIGINVLNTTVEDQIAKQIDSLIPSSALNNKLAYSDIEMDAANGRIAMRNVNLPLDEQNVAIKAGLIEVKVAPSEVAKVAVNKESGALSQAQIIGVSLELDIPDSDVTTSMTSVDLTVHGEVGQKHLADGNAVISGTQGVINDLSITSEEQGMDVEFGKLTFTAEGDFSQKSLESSSARINDAHIVAEDIKTVSSESGMRAEIGSLDAVIKGDVSQDILSGDLSALFEQPNSVQLTIRDTTTTIDQALVADTDMMGFETILGSFLEEVTIEEMTLDMDTSAESLKINSLDLASDLVSGKAVMNAGLDAEQKMETVDFAMEVESLDPAIKTMVSPILAFMGKPIPADGAFTFTYNLSAEGMSFDILGE